MREQRPHSGHGRGDGVGGSLGGTRGADTGRACHRSHPEEQDHVRSVQLGTHTGTQGHPDPLLGSHGTFWGPADKHVCRRGCGELRCLPATHMPSIPSPSRHMDVMSVFRCWYKHLQGRMRACSTHVQRWCAGTRLLSVPLWPLCPPAAPLRAQKRCPLCKACPLAVTLEHQARYTCWAVSQQKCGC